MEISYKIPSDISSTSPIHVSDDNVQLYCRPCDQDGTRVPAYGFCRNCAEHLCKFCYKVHLKPTPLRNHVLIDSSNMPQSQQQSRPQTSTDFTEQCQLHSGKLIEYFCRDHNIFGCSPCIIMNHTACKIDYIPDAAKNYDTSQEYRNVLDTLNTLYLSCEKMAQAAKINKKKMQEKYDAIKKDIRKFRQEINRILDYFETKAVQTVDQLLWEETMRVDYTDSEISKLAKEIEDLQKEFKDSQRSRKLDELFIKAKKSGVKIKDYATVFSQMQENNYIKNATFKRNLNIERIIRTEECLGEFTFEKDKLSHVNTPLATANSSSKETKREAQESDQQQEKTDTIKNSTSGGPGTVDSQLLLQQQQQRYRLLNEPARLQLQQARQQPNLTYDKIRATFSGKIDLTVPHDTGRCQIRGIAVVSRDTIAVTDYNNFGVKLVDTVQNKVVSSLKMSAKPWDMATLPDNQVAVTLPDSCIIQVLSTSGSMYTVRQVKVDGKCWGLAYSVGHFVVGFDSPGKVQVMTSEGKVLRTIQYDKALFLFKRNVFTWPQYVTVDESNKTIYVSDAYSEGRGRTRLSWEGEVTGVNKDSELPGSNGIIALQDGSLLVCYYLANALQLVSPDFTTSRIILQDKDGLSYPHCVALHTEQNKLYVGCYSDNSLLLYDMK